MLAVFKNSMMMPDVYWHDAYGHVLKVTQTCHHGNYCQPACTTKMQLQGQLQLHAQSPTPVPFHQLTGNEAGRVPLCSTAPQ